jgi:hypothetical protein
MLSRFIHLYITFTIKHVVPLQMFVARTITVLIWLSDVLYWYGCQMYCFGIAVSCIVLV